MLPSTQRINVGLVGCGTRIRLVCTKIGAFNKEAQHTPSNLSILGLLRRNGILTTYTADNSVLAVQYTTAVESMLLPGRSRSA